MVSGCKTDTETGKSKSLDKTDTETNDTRSEALRLKRSLKAKIKTNTETDCKRKEEKLSNQVKIVPCFIEKSLNESLSSRDQDFYQLVSAFETETETLKSRSQFRDQD